MQIYNIYLNNLKLIKLFNNTMLFIFNLFINLNNLHKSELKQISSFESSILVNKWINLYNTNADNNDNILINHNYVLKSLMDFKVNIAINKNNQNTKFYKYIYNDMNLYTILTKEENNILFIKRIGINPIFIINEVDINYDSKLLLFRLLELKSEKQLKINFTQLYDYDPRYKLSWNYDNN